MIKVSKRTQYGLRAMVLLAKNYKPKKILSVKIISEKEEIPFDFMSKIIMQLERVKLVKGIKGVQGGYILSKNPKEISANDIVSALEDRKKTVDCTLCGREKGCLTKSVWTKVDFALEKTLKSMTLSYLIK